MIEPMKAKQSLKAAELQDGDIVCFQKVTDGKSPEPKSSESSSDRSASHLTSQLTLADTDGRSISPNKTIKPAPAFEDARTFYDFLLHKKVVSFQPHPKNQIESQQESFELSLSIKESYDSFAAKVGAHINVLPTHLRFWTIHNNGNPKLAVKRSQNQTLLGALNPPYSSFSNTSQKPDCLYYEVLEISLSEMDTKKAMKIIWLSEGISKEVYTFHVYVCICADIVPGIIRGSDT
jgi:ubiquitin carboxyl-terminal hydrolase 7